MLLEVFFRAEVAGTPSVSGILGFVIFCHLLDR